MESKLTKSIVFSILISSVLVGCTDESQSDKTQNKESIQQEPYVSMYDIEKEAHSVSRSWYRVNVTGKFSGNCEGISSDPSADTYSHYRGSQVLKYATKSNDGKEFSIGYQVGGMGGEESFYRYTTTSQWCENVLAAILKR